MHSNLQPLLRETGTHTTTASHSQHSWAVLQLGASFRGSDVPSRRRAERSAESGVLHDGAPRSATRARPGSQLSELAAGGAARLERRGGAQRARISDGSPL